MKTKQKLFPILLALVCALTWLFGLVACADPADGYVKATVAESDYLNSVDIYQKNSDDDWVAVSSSIRKGAETRVRIQLNAKYNLGGLKVLVDGTEMTTEKVDNNNPYALFNTSVFKPTADFEVTFSGEAEHKKTNVIFKIDCPDTAWKEQFNGVVRVKVLVNGAMVSAYTDDNGDAVTFSKFETLIADNPIVLNSYEDHFDLYIYTNFDGYDIVAEGNMEVAGIIKNISDYTLLENDKKSTYKEGLAHGAHFEFDANKEGSLTITLSTAGVKAAQ